MTTGPERGQPVATFADWLALLDDYPSIADCDQPDQRVYIRAAEARALLERAWQAGLNAGISLALRHTEGGR